MLCEYCKKKKVGIINFPCKCEYKNLCMKCRLPSDHNCQFDYKQEWKEELKKQMPVIVADKINKI
jgi:hypothetical protein